MRGTISEEGASPWEVREDERPLLGRHLVLFGPELVQQLATHRLEHRPEQRPPEDHGGLRVRQAVAERRHVAEAQPPASPREPICQRVKPRATAKVCFGWGNFLGNFGVAGTLFPRSSCCNVNCWNHVWLETEEQL